MSSFGSDGASVMTGRHAGVATLLHSKNSQMIAVHCILGHRTSLKHVSYIKKMKDYLFALWNYFHHSSVRSAGLKQVQELMQIPELKLVKAVDTHWLSNKAAVNSLLRCLSAVIVTLQKSSDPTAIGLMKILTRYNFVASLVLLDDALFAVSCLSLAFQRATIDLTVISPLLQSTMSSFKKLQQEPAADFRAKVNRLVTKTAKEVAEIRQSNDVGDTDESDVEVDTQELITIREGEPERYEENVRQKFLAQVIINLEERFPQVNTLEAFSILDPSGLLSDETGLSGEHLERLLDHYAEGGVMGINKLQCTAEYREFITFVKKHAKLKLCKTLQELALQVLSSKMISDLFPLVCNLLLHAFVLPMSTSDCERCFSTMK